MKNNKKTKALAFLGTGSDVGKSIITAGFCRILFNNGYSVAPYKAQNMSNNSWVTLDRGEMGRAQIVQAQACYIEPDVDMNPVLLKPSSNQGSQVIIQGKVYADKNARDYFKVHDYCKKKAFESYERLESKYDYICLEGAGSCAEMNLKDRDFVNFSAARRADAPVILIADIDRGGVFAQIIGTLNILSDEERDMVKGVIINRFRGDKTLFDDGVTYLEEKINIPILGVVSYLHSLDIDAEDSLPLDSILDPVSSPDTKKISIAVLYLHHISNHTDFNVLRRVPGVELHFLSKPRDLSDYDCIIIPGTKNVCSDMNFLRKSGWDALLKQFNGKIVGICGGYQMLGKKISDPYGVEGDPGVADGFGLLDVETVLEKNKKLARVKGWCALFSSPFEGYEIHMGETNINSGNRLLTVEEDANNSDTDSYADGCISLDGRVLGTYVHGILNNEKFLKSFLQWINTTKADIILQDSISIPDIHRELDKFASHLAESIDVEKTLDILEKGL